MLADFLRRNFFKRSTKPNISVFFSFLYFYHHRFLVFKVHIMENRNLTRLHVPALRRHEITTSASETDLKGVSIRRGDGGRSAVIKYAPDVGELQERLKSKHALQFVVEYDVDRPGGKAGEIQV